jgi:hypothetical protein
MEEPPSDLYQLLYIEMFVEWVHHALCEFHLHFINIFQYRALFI